MNSIKNRLISQEKKLKFNIIPKDILNEDISLLEKEILVFLYLINIKNIIPIISICRRWSMKKTTSKRIPTQLIKHLKSLEVKGYISLIYNGCKLSSVKINNEKFNNSLILYIPKDISKNLKFSLKHIYISVYELSRGDLKINTFVEKSKKIGVSRQTLSKYIKSNNSFKSQPLNYRGYRIPNYKINKNFHLRFKPTLYSKYVNKNENKVYDFLTHSLLNIKFNNKTLICTQRLRQKNILLKKREELLMKAKQKIFLAEFNNLADEEKNFIINGIQMNLMLKGINVEKSNLKISVDTKVQFILDKSDKEKQFNSSYDLVRYLSSLFTKKTYISLDEALSDEFIFGIQQRVKREKDMTYDENFIRWKMREIFKKNTFNKFDVLENFIFTILMNENKSGAATDGWDEFYNSDDWKDLIKEEEKKLRNIHSRKLNYKEYKDDLNSAVKKICVKNILHAC